MCSDGFSLCCDGFSPFALDSRCVALGSRRLRWILVVRDRFSLCCVGFSSFVLDSRCVVMDPHCAMMGC